MLLGKNRAHLDSAAAGKKLPGIQELVSMLITFTLTVFAWIFFRAETIAGAFRYIAGICSKSLFSMPAMGSETISRMNMGSIFVSVPLLIMVEWINRNEEYGFRKHPRNKFARWLGYIIVALLIIELGGRQQEFIYFQF
jgi:hypothetical protein